MGIFGGTPQEQIDLASINDRLSRLESDIPATRVLISVGSRPMPRSSALDDGAAMTPILPAIPRPDSG